VLTSFTSGGVNVVHLRWCECANSGVNFVSRDFSWPVNLWQTFVGLVLYIFWVICWAIGYHYFKGNTFERRLCVWKLYIIVYFTFPDYVLHYERRAWKLDIIFYFTFPDYVLHCDSGWFEEGYFIELVNFRWESRFDAASANVRERPSAEASEYPRVGFEAVWDPGSLSASGTGIWRD